MNGRNTAFQSGRLFRFRKVLRAILVLHQCYVATTAQDDDKLRYDEVLFAGTHNSGINLGGETIGRPSAAKGGRWPSEAHSSYQYPIMDQRLSVRDQLEMGIRVIDLEIAALTSEWTCPPTNDTAAAVRASLTECKEEYDLHGRCFRGCPFIVSHGNLKESIGAGLGYSYPETLFESIAAWVKENPGEIVTVALIVTHGNTSPRGSAIAERMQSAGLLQSIWNPNPSQPLSRFPTLGEMRTANRTVLVVGPDGWGPPWTVSHVNATGVEAAEETCVDATPCMEGWDSITVAELEPQNAVLSVGQCLPPDTPQLFAITHLSSRRGRDERSAKYWPLPNIAHDEPFLAGGNPAQAALAANYSFIRAVAARWEAMLKPCQKLPNWILVDFFNTTTPSHGKASRSLLPNPNEGLVAAVAAVNAQRRGARGAPPGFKRT